MTRYRASIDYGTSYSAGAFCDLPSGRPELVRFDNHPAIPSLVVRLDGQLLAGSIAESSIAIADPGDVVLTPKKHLGSKAPLFRSPVVSPEDAVAATLQVLLDELVAGHNGRPPDELRLTHPARWEETRLAALVAAGEHIGLKSIELVPEPVAAALHLAGDVDVPVGGFVAIYDFGAGTFDTAVLKRTKAGFQTYGPAGGLELGGEDLDDALLAHLVDRFDPIDRDEYATSTEKAWREGRRTFRVNVRNAKHAVGMYDRPTTIAYPGPRDHPPLRITPEEFNDLVEPRVEETVAELERTIRDAGLSNTQLAAVYLAGGSSRIGLVSRLMESRFADLVRTSPDRKAPVALGAAGATAEALRGTQTPTRKPPPEARAPYHDAEMVLEGVRSSIRSGDSIYAVDDTDRIVRIYDLAQPTPKVAWAEAPTGEGVLLAASSGGVVAAMNGEAKVYKRDLTLRESFALPGVSSAIVAGPTAAWVHVNFGFRFDRLNRTSNGHDVLIRGIGVARLPLIGPASDSWFALGEEWRYLSVGDHPIGASLSLENRDGSAAVLIFSAGSQKLFRWNAWQQIDTIPATGTDITRTRGVKPWAYQVASEGWTRLSANSSGLAGANNWRASMVPGVFPILDGIGRTPVTTGDTVALPTMGGAGAWVLSRHGLFAVTESPTGLRICRYGTTLGTEQELARETGKELPLTRGRNRWWVDDDDGVWITAWDPKENILDYVHIHPTLGKLHSVRRKYDGFPLGAAGGKLYVAELARRPLSLLDATTLDADEILHAKETIIAADLRDFVVEAIGDSVTAAAMGPRDNQVMEELRNIANLHEMGILSDEEFAAAKAKAIGVSTNA